MGGRSRRDSGTVRRGWTSTHPVSPATEERLSLPPSTVEEGPQESRTGEDEEPRHLSPEQESKLVRTHVCTPPLFVPTRVPDSEPPVGVGTSTCGPTPEWKLGFPGTLPTDEGTFEKPTKDKGRTEPLSFAPGSKTTLLAVLRLGRGRRWGPRE